jgi:hypothetical protein
LKKSILTLVAVNIFGLSTQAGLISVPTINDVRNSVSVELINNNSNDLICSSVEISIKVQDREFRENLGTPVIYLTDQYFLNKSSKSEIVDLDELGYDSSKVVIDSVRSSVSDCRKPSFEEYCELALKTTEEQYTLDVLMRNDGTWDCNQLDNAVGKYLTIKRSNIVNIKPISFLTNVKYLNLKINKISTIDELLNLKNLIKINISDNPVIDITPLLKLPNLKEINAKRTLVDELPKDIKLKKLKSLNLSNTPFSERTGINVPIKNKTELNGNH